MERIARKEQIDAAQQKVVERNVEFSKHAERRHLQRMESMEENKNKQLNELQERLRDHVRLKHARNLPRQHAQTPANNNKLNKNASNTKKQIHSSASYGYITAVRPPHSTLISLLYICNLSTYSERKYLI